MRLIVTRPREDAEALKAKLEARGHTVILSPLIEVVPIAGTVIPNKPYQLIALTSANGARALSRHPALPRLHSIPAFTVGPQSAEAAKCAGFSDVHVAGGDAVGLAQHIAEACDPETGAILYVSGRDSASDFTGKLKA